MACRPHSGGVTFNLLHNPVPHTFPPLLRRNGHVWSWRSRNPVASGSRWSALRSQAPRHRPVARQDDGRVQEGDEGHRGRGERTEFPPRRDRAGTGQGSATGNPDERPEVRRRPGPVERPAEGVTRLNFARGANLDSAATVSYHNRTSGKHAGRKWAINSVARVRSSHG